MDNLSQYNEKMNDLDAFLDKYAPIPKRRASLSSSMALLLIQKLRRPNYRCSPRGVDKKKLQEQFSAGGDDGTKDDPGGNC